MNNDYQRAGHDVTLVPTAAPPFLNGPGRVLRFALEGYGGVNADELAAFIHRCRRRLYIRPRDARSHWTYGLKDALAGHR